MNIVTNTPGISIEMKPSDGVREVLTSETLSIAVIGQRLASVEVNGKPETPPTIDVGTGVPVNATVTFPAPGRYSFRLVGTDGAVSGLTVLACEPEAFFALPHGATAGHGVGDARSILRSLAAHAPWFHGRREDLHNRSLRDYGG